MQPFTFFISYRRQDTAPIALLLKYEIEKRLQFVRVIVDVEEIRLGDVFPDRIEQLIESAHATLVLIGKNWMPHRGEPDAREANGPAALDKDWIVEELVHSVKSRIEYNEENRYGQEARALMPIFVDCERTFNQFDLPTAIADIPYRQAERIDYANWPRYIGLLLDQIAVTFNLKKRPDKDEYPTPDVKKASTQSLADRELASILKYQDYEGWYLDNFGNTDVSYLVKTFEFPHFNQAADFMEVVANYCRVLDHHPEWRNVFKHVTVSLTTWDARRRVTIYDLNLALFMNKAARAILKKVDQR
jgi:pterin-4a-carbinolamine dehydratase